MITLIVSGDDPGFAAGRVKSKAIVIAASPQNAQHLVVKSTE